jgi:hypothetical protein
MIMLTTTLPISMENWFHKQILVSEAIIIQAYTTKQNIRYRVTRVQPGKITIEDGVVVEM